MSTQALQFQPPTSLLGTLAAYEARRKSESGVPVDTDSRRASLSGVSTAFLPDAEAIYARTLPSLHFLRWRPMYHLQAPSGWMNDPCAPGYDATTGLYHLFFQWNPKRNKFGSVAWGSISWGHATSTDTINWTVSGVVAIKPGSWYDREGCFTGCMLPTGLDGQAGKLTLFYTGVSRLPLHYTLPYKPQTETLAIAQSSDGGDHFQKMNGNPVLPQPPQSMSVTGWRDPYVAPWPSMDTLLQRNHEKTMYGLISGGVRDRGPTAFLYAVNPEKLSQWVFLSDLVEMPSNHNISRWSGDMGINWECATFMTLTSDVDGSSREFIVVGAEGSDAMHPNSTFTTHPQEETKFPRAERSIQWMCGSLETTTSTDGSVLPKMRYISGGRFDHAAMYGVNTFHDPHTDRRIAWGWVTEEDLPQRLVDRQNWSGMLGVPRELSLQCITGVVGALRSELSEITSVEREEGAQNCFTIRTLGISPSRQLEPLREHAKFLEMPCAQSLPTQDECFLDVQTCRFELAASFYVSNTCSLIGLNIHHSEDMNLSFSTRIYLDVNSETMLIDRPDASKIDAEIVTYTERAPFTLFSRKAADGRVEREQLQVRVFFDESVVEVFVNDRCTFAARVYPNTKRCWGINFWAEDDQRTSALLMARSWDGLRADMKVKS